VYETLFKVKKEWIFGKTDYDIFPREFADKFCFDDKQVLGTSKTLESEDAVPQMDGMHTYITIKFPLFDLRGVPYAVAGISTDITDRKRIEVEREELLVKEQHALVVAQKSIEARDDFITIASHELRTPLTPLRMYLDMLKKALRDVPAEVLPKINILKVALDKTEVSLERLIKLTRDLLDVSRITSGGMSLKFERFNLSELLSEVLEHYDWQLKNAKCDISTMIDGEVWGLWDRSRIEQVIDNLMSNAIKYGVGKLIEIALEKNPTKAILTVRDHGIGIDKEEQSKIFERFERATSARHYEGIGLGLYISREIVNAHGGTIRVESELEHGANFIVELPFDSLNFRFV
jgi:signal transduction histidine kinase